MDFSATSFKLDIAIWQAEHRDLASWTSRSGKLDITIWNMTVLSGAVTEAGITAFGIGGDGECRPKRSLAAEPSLDWRAGQFSTTTLAGAL